jgi:hypothetical protein
LASVPGRKFSTRTSALSSRRSMMRRPSGRLKSIAMLSLLRFVPRKYALSPPTNAPLAGQSTVLAVRAFQRGHAERRICRSSSSRSRRTYSTKSRLTSSGVASHPTAPSRGGDRPSTRLRLPKARLSFNYRCLARGQSSPMFHGPSWAGSLPRGFVSLGGKPPS